MEFVTRIVNVITGRNTRDALAAMQSRIAQLEADSDVMSVLLKQQTEELAACAERAEDTLDVDDIVERVTSSIDYAAIAEGIEARSIARELDTHDIACEVDVYDVAREIDTDSIAENVMDRIDSDDIAREAAKQVAEDFNDDDMLAIAQHIDSTKMTEAINDNLGAVVAEHVNAETVEKIARLVVSERVKAMTDEAFVGNIVNVIAARLTHGAPANRDARGDEMSEVNTGNSE